MAQRLYRRLKKKGFTPRHVAEVGVYLPETSNVYEYVVEGVRCTLIEPDPESIAAITGRFGARGNVSLHPVAVYDRPGRLELVKRGASTYAAAETASPAVVNDRYIVQDSDRFHVDAVTFDQIDDGSIELLSIDIEGGEWFVLKAHAQPPGRDCARNARRSLSQPAHGGNHGLDARQCLRPLVQGRVRFGVCARGRCARDCRGSARARRDRGTACDDPVQKARSRSGSSGTSCTRTAFSL